MSQPLEDYCPEAVYDLTVVRFEPSNSKPRPIAKEHRVKSVTELDQQLASFASEDLLAVLLDEILLEEDEEVHWGSFFLAVNGERAWLHLMAGPCFTGRDSANAAAGGATMKFILDNGEWTEVKVRDTVTREQGLLALRHWMATKEQLPALEWSRG